ncbi:hypothetical protein [Clostridium sp. BSD9I1]|uniref:hypothetical protein n=1 Tax=Clostridium sp. BSD9I1 TaxID=2003589 RepID=UPI0016453D62|nr:hypothetical protein [Clostridium sp. BSD9I1]
MEDGDSSMDGEINNAFSYVEFIFYIFLLNVIICTNISSPGDHILRNSNSI